MRDHRPKRLSSLAAGMLSAFPGAQAVPKQLPTIQAGWAEFEVLARGRKWPETVIEIARQAYFAGAARHHDIVSSMPMDANIAGRVHQSIQTELRQHDEEMVRMREMRGKAQTGDE